MFVTRPPVACPGSPTSALLGPGPSPLPSVPRPAPSAAGSYPTSGSHRQIIESRLWRLLPIPQGQNKCSWPGRSPSCSQCVPPLLLWIRAPEKLTEALLRLPALVDWVHICQGLSDSLSCPFLLFSLEGSFAFHENKKKSPHFFPGWVGRVAQGQPFHSKGGCQRFSATLSSAPSRDEWPSREKT